MEPSAPTESTPGLNPVGASFHAAPKKEPQKAKRSTFSRAARVTDELSPASRTSSGPEFHSQHGSFVWQHESVSKKGYTAGFASQTPRLGTSFRYTGPGPGTAVFAWYATATLSATKTTNHPAASRLVSCAKLGQQASLLIQGMHHFRPTHSSGIACRLA